MIGMGERRKRSRRRDKKAHGLDGETKTRGFTVKSRNGSTRVTQIAASGAFALFMTIYLLRLDQVVGMIVDDAWYVMLARALATGEGYRLINSPSPGIQPSFPPGFPALLSIFYRLSPDFPDNVWLLKSVSIAAMLGVGIVAYLYFKRYREMPDSIAFGLAMATAIYPAMVFLATSSVMSECVFTLAQLAAILAIERSRADGNARWRYIAIGGALASFAFLTRPAGVSLLVAVAIYLLKERAIRSAVIFAAIVTLFVGPWIAYSRSHTRLPEHRVEAGGIVQSYKTTFWQRVAGDPFSGVITFEELPDRIRNNMAEVARYNIGGLVIYSSFRGIEPGQQVIIGGGHKAFSLTLMLLTLIGFVSSARRRVTLAEIVVPFSMAVTVLWGWEQFRLLLPLVPFLLFYLLIGFRGAIRLSQRLISAQEPGEHWVTLKVIIWVIVAANVYANVSYIHRRYASDPADRLRWISAFEENEAMIKYIGERLPRDAVIATQNPALVHLYTGHRTVVSDDPAGCWDIWKRMGVRYLAYTSQYRLPDPEKAESRFQSVYRSRGALNLRVLDLGPASSRQPWDS